MPFAESFKAFWDGDWIDTVPRKLGGAAKPTIERASFAGPSRSPRKRSVQRAPRPSTVYATPVSIAKPQAMKHVGKRPSSPSRSGPSLPRKKVPDLNGNPVRLRALRKKDGKTVMTGKIINPDGVVAGRISKRFPSTLKLAHSKGFLNQGQQCWRNAALQGLLHVPALYHFFGNIHRDCDRSPKRCVTCALQDLFQRYWSLGSVKEDGKTLHYADLDAAVLTNIPTTPINARGDLHDLVDWHTDRQDDAKLYIDKLLELVVGAADEYDLAYLKQVFEMQRKATWTCVECGEAHDSSKDSEDESGFSLTVPLNMPPGNREGMSFMERLHVNVFTDEGVQARCTSEFCKANRRLAGISEKDVESLPMQTKHYTITKAPEVLVVLQKRFAMVMDDNGKPKIRRGRGIEAKITEETWMEEYINLGRYTEDDEDLLYRLDAVVAHRGECVRTGHYIAVVRDANGVDYTTINDSVVEAGVNSNTLKYPRSNNEDFDPYIMLYSKV